jgi:Ras-related protein Rab-11A
MISQLEEEYDCLYKLVLVGDSGVGKTNLLKRFLVDEFETESRATIGVEFATKTVRLASRVIKAQIWDTAGQERFRSITNAYYKGAVGAFLVYDLTQRHTFQSVSKWLRELHEHSSPGIALILLANKTDLQEARQVCRQEGEALAASHGMLFLETSARAAENVDLAFEELIREIIRRPDLNSPTPVSVSAPKPINLDSS